MTNMLELTSLSKGLIEDNKDIRNKLLKRRDMISRYTRLVNEVKFNGLIRRFISDFRRGYGFLLYSKANSRDRIEYDVHSINGILTHEIIIREKNFKYREIVDVQNFDNNGYWLKYLYLMKDILKQRLRNDYYPVNFRAVYQTNEEDDQNDQNNTYQAIDYAIDFSKNLIYPYDLYNDYQLQQRIL